MVNYQLNLRKIGIAKFQCGESSDLSGQEMLRRCISKYSAEPGCFSMNRGLFDVAGFDPSFDSRQPIATNSARLCYSTGARRSYPTAWNRSFLYPTAKTRPNSFLRAFSNFSSSARNADSSALKCNHSLRGFRRACDCQNCITSASIVPKRKTDS